MLKLNCSYAKKLPAETQFSSESFHASIETELPDSLAADPAGLRQHIHTTFNQLKDAVETELSNGNGKQSSAPARDRPAGDRQPANGFGAPASNKQVKFATDLAASLDIGVNDLNAHIQKKYGVKGLYDLNRKQATELIDDLKARREKAA